MGLDPDREVANGSISCPRYWKGPGNGAFLIFARRTNLKTFAQLLPELGSLYPCYVTDGSAAVVPYDPEWAGRFEAERTILEETLGRWLDGDIEHVGSTSVPGLSAKPVIDMIAPVRDLEAARSAFGPLSALGYQHRDHRPKAHAFCKPASADWWEQTHHLHLAERASDIWRERLAFRDALRADPALAAQYEDWKLREARGAGAENPYAGDKFPFVARVLAESGITLKPDSERLTPTALEDRQR